MKPFDASRKEALHGGKRKHCLFSTLSKTEIIIFVTFNLSFANAFNLVWSKFLSCGNGLVRHITLTSRSSDQSDFLGYYRKWKYVKTITLAFLYSNAYHTMNLIT